MHGYEVAKSGNKFVLTEQGYEQCKRLGNEKILKEREVGKPVGQYIRYAPESWIKKGWVQEVKI